MALRLGIIGANPDRGWALTSHLPALRALDDVFTVQAVSTRRIDTARRAAELFGARAAYEDYRALLADPNVEAVTISVRLQHHHELVSAAIAAGKHVYCEWPLAPTVAEAEDLAARAQKSGLHTMVGLQAQLSPEIAHLRRLLAAGHIGELLSVSVVASGFGWGEAVDPDQVYLRDQASGATMLSITGGHLLDAVLSACGEIESLSAVLATQHKRVAILSTEDMARLRKFEAVLDWSDRAPENDPHVIPVKDTLAPTAADQVLLSGRLRNGAMISLHIRGGMLRGSGLLVEITGTRGELRLTGPAGVIQMVPLALFGARGMEASFQPIAPPGAKTHHKIVELPAVAANVARMYAAFAKDITTGVRSAPSFAHACRRHRLLEAIETSAQTGERVDFAV